MTFGAIFGLRVVRWLLVLRDARLRVGSLEATQAGARATSRPRFYHGTMVRARRCYPSSARLGPWQQWQGHVGQHADTQRRKRPPP